MLLNELSEGVPIVTLTDVVEFTFCARFTYFMHCLNIPQHEERLYKVRKGRIIHKVRSLTNRQYLRHKIDVVRKENEVSLTSKAYRIKGKVDEVLFLADGSAAPLEYKFAEFKQNVWTTHLFQLTLQAMLISENYGVAVNSGFVCYTRSSNLIKRIDFETVHFEKALATVENLLKIIDTGHYPNKGTPKSRCRECCYKNVCT
jgi:CRISPR-associated exonuclease Cas4